jgi:hypothetical protein
MSLCFVSTASLTWGLSYLVASQESIAFVKLGYSELRFWLASLGNPLRSFGRPLPSRDGGCEPSCFEAEAGKCCLDNCFGFASVGSRTRHMEIARTTSDVTAAVHRGSFSA